MTWDKPAILVVDDSLTDRVRTSGLIRRFLPSADVEVLSNAQDAMVNLKAAPFDIVVTDLVMPDGDGRDLLDSIQELPHPPAVILVTAQGNERVAAACLRRGAVAYLRKENLAQELGDALSETRATIREEEVHYALMSRVTQARCEFEIDSDLKQIQAISNFLVQRLRTTLRISAQQLNAIISCVHEALLNAHFHGNMQANDFPLQRSRMDYMRVAEAHQQQPEFADCRIRLIVDQRKDLLKITVSDQGNGFDHRKVCQSNDTAHQDRGNGIRTMMKSMSQVDWNDVGNEVTLTQNYTNLISTPEDGTNPSHQQKSSAEKVS